MPLAHQLHIRWPTSRDFRHFRRVDAEAIAAAYLLHIASPRKRPLRPAGDIARDAIFATRSCCFRRCWAITPYTIEDILADKARLGRPTPPIRAACAGASTHARATLKYLQVLSMLYLKKCSRHALYSVPPHRHAAKASPATTLKFPLAHRATAPLTSQCRTP